MAQADVHLFSLPNLRPGVTPLRTTDGFTVGLSLLGRHHLCYKKEMLGEREHAGNGTGVVKKAAWVNFLDTYEHLRCASWRKVVEDFLECLTEELADKGIVHIKEYCRLKTTIGGPKKRLMVRFRGSSKRSWEEEITRLRKTPKPRLTEEELLLFRLDHEADKETLGVAIGSDRLYCAHCGLPKGAGHTGHCEYYEAVREQKELRASAVRREQALHRRKEKSAETCKVQADAVWKMFRQGAKRNTICRKLKIRYRELHLILANPPPKHADAAKKLEWTWKNWKDRKMTPEETKK